ncbi:stage 0 sporulation family protein [Oscillospiraceae bacterium MB08-C2-2]|nr:stage 0 sporulation family protein [Oscillospiraceae bacterium MB08-C2-2]
MAQIIGVRFKSVGKIYYFDPVELEVTKGDRVIVETARGVECGDVVLSNREVEDDKVVQPLKRVLRKANQEDLLQLEANREKEVFALAVCNEKIRKHKLEMKLISVEYTFDNNKVLFYFTAEGRVDFRNLVKDLAAVLRTRIELRQIGVRDEAKILGGLGICGRPFCCATFLGEFQPVSIKMPKEQGLSLNPTKISGTCGRLMCCLKYEQNAYEDLLRTTPRVGAQVTTPEGPGVVTEVSLLTGMLKIRLDKSTSGGSSPFHKDTIKVIKDGSRSKGGKSRPAGGKDKNNENKAFASGDEMTEEELSALADE